MKRITLKIVLISMILILLTCCTVLATDITIEIVTNRISATYGIGEEIRTEVWWNTEMQATGFTIDYDNTKLTFKNASIEESYYNVLNEGKIVVSWASFDDIDFTNLVFNFTTKELGEAEVFISSVDGFADGNLVSPDNIDYTTLGKKVIKIIEFGEINNDGRVDAADAGLINRYMLGEIELTDAQLLNADVNLDGYVNNIDAELISKKDAGLVNLPLVYGDINNSGAADQDDAMSIEGYLNGEVEFTNHNILQSDVNLDGIVNNLDVDLIMKSSVGKLGLPFIYGDLNCDGIADAGDAGIIASYLEGKSELEEIQLLKADVNLDGFVNKIDAELISKKDAGKINLPVMYGDLNCDGTVNKEDSLLLQEYLSEEFPDLNIENLTEQQKICIDINLDEKTDYLDVEILKRYLSDSTGYPLPILYGDVNKDGFVNQNDITLLNTYINESNRAFHDAVFIRADVNIDGIMDFTDLSLITNHITKVIDKLPVRTFINSNMRVVQKGINGNYLFGFQNLKNTIQDIGQYFSDSIYIRVNGTLIDNETRGLIGTGNVIQVNYTESNGADSISSVYRAVIYGDTTGDGKINAIDALALIKDINNKIKFTDDIYIEAGRITVDSSENPTAVDALAIIKHANGKYLIDQTKAN